MALQLLLGAQLETEVRQLALAALAVLAGAVFTAVDRGLRTAPDVLAQPAVELVFCRMALAHRISFQKVMPAACGNEQKETRPPLAPHRGPDRPFRARFAGMATGHRQINRRTRRPGNGAGIGEKPAKCQPNAPSLTPSTGIASQFSEGSVSRHAYGFAGDNGMGQSALRRAWMAVARSLRLKVLLPRAGSAAHSRRACGLRLPVG